MPKFSVSTTMGGTNREDTTSLTPYGVREEIMFIVVRLFRSHPVFSTLTVQIFNFLDCEMGTLEESIEEYVKTYYSEWTMSRFWMGCKAEEYSIAA